MIVMTIIIVIVITVMIVVIIITVLIGIIVVIAEIETFFWGVIFGAWPGNSVDTAVKPTTRIDRTASAYKDYCPCWGKPI